MKKETAENIKRKAIEDKGGVCCDNFEECGKRATRNIQNPMIVWRIDAKGNYSKNPIEYGYDNIDGDDNHHLCEGCEPEYN